MFHDVSLSATLVSGKAGGTRDKPMVGRSAPVALAARGRSRPLRPNDLWPLPFLDSDCVANSESGRLWPLPFLRVLTVLCVHDSDCVANSESGLRVLCVHNSECVAKCPLLLWNYRNYCSTFPTTSTGFLLRPILGPLRISPRQWQDIYRRRR